MVRKKNQRKRATRYKTWKRTSGVIIENVYLQAADQAGIDDEVGGDHHSRQLEYTFIRRHTDDCGTRSSNYRQKAQGRQSFFSNIQHGLFDPISVDFSQSSSIIAFYIIIIYPGKVQYVRDVYVECSRASGIF